MTHQDIRQQQVSLVVYKFCPVYAGRMEPGLARDRYRRRRVPLVEPAAVEISVRLAIDDGRGLRPRRAQRHQLAADAGGDGGGPLRGAAPPYHDAQRGFWGTRGGGVSGGGQDLALRGKGHGTG